MAVDSYRDCVVEIVKHNGETCGKNKFVIIRIHMSKDAISPCGNEGLLSVLELVVVPAYTKLVSFRVYLILQGVFVQPETSLAPP